MPPAQLRCPQSHGAEGIPPFADRAQAALQYSELRVARQSHPGFLQRLSLICGHPAAWRRGGFVISSIVSLLSVDEVLRSCPQIPFQQRQVDAAPRDPRFRW